MLYALPEEMEIYCASRSSLLCPASPLQLSLMGLEEMWEREVLAASTGSNHCPIYLPTSILPAGEGRGRDIYSPDLHLDLIIFLSPPALLQMTFTCAPSPSCISGCYGMKWWWQVFARKGQHRVHRFPEVGRDIWRLSSWWTLCWKHGHLDQVAQ